MYCIMCEKEVRVFHGAITGDFHLYAVPLPDGMVGVDDCDGPFAYCPPPEYPADWIDFVVEPGKELELS